MPSDDRVLPRSMGAAATGVAQAQPRHDRVARRLVLERSQQLVERRVCLVDAFLVFDEAGDLCANRASAEHLDEAVAPRAVGNAQEVGRLCPGGVLRL